MLILPGPQIVFGMIESHTTSRRGKAKATDFCMSKSRKMHLVGEIKTPPKHTKEGTASPASG